MKKAIYKYPLKITETQYVILPEGAQILTVQAQFKTPCLWALVDPDEQFFKERTIEIFGTGEPIDNAKRTYISTFQIIGGELIFHVFERLP